MSSPHTRLGMCKAYPHRRLISNPTPTKPRMRILLPFLLFVAPLSLQSQDNIATISQIAVTGRAEVKISPDRATIQIRVQTRAATAAVAAADNATKLNAVLSALRTLGLTNDQLSTVNYSVYPEQRYEQGKEPEVVAYNVTN